MTGPTIDPSAFRHVLGHFPTGVVAITAIAEDGSPTGMAVGSFTSVSLDPPLVAFFPDKTSTSFPRMRTSPSFCVNVLSDDQESVCRTFATRGTDKFAELTWRPAASGSPILDDVLAWIDCDVERIDEAGDHYIVLGRVRALEVATDTSPLIFFQGGYGRFSAPSLSAPATSGLLEPLGDLDVARTAMERLAAELDVEASASAIVDDEIVVVGHAGAPSRPVPSRAGARIPFVPPLGTLFVAWAGAEAVEGWLDRLDPAADRAACRAMLERVRARGWSMSLASDPSLALEAAVAAASGERPRAEHREAIAAAAAALRTDGYEPAELGDEPLPVRFLAAPVVDASGEVVLQLGLYGLPTDSSPPEVQRYLAALMAAANEVTLALGGRPPARAAA